MSASEHSLVVFVHGLWMNGMELALLRRRVVKQCEYRTARFVYPTVRRQVAGNAEALFAFARRLQAKQMHFVGYSLGGVVALEMLARHGDQLPDGRVVLIGSPVRGSRAARNFARRPWSRRLLGESVHEGLLDDHAAQWSATRELGVIAGTRSLGLGRLWGELSQPNDGTVAVEETRLPGETARVELPQTHLSMLFSAQVATAVCAFLRRGEFPEPSRGDSGGGG